MTMLSLAKEIRLPGFVVTSATAELVESLTPPAFPDNTDEIVDVNESLKVIVKINDVGTDPLTKVSLGDAHWKGKAVLHSVDGGINAYAFVDTLISFSAAETLVFEFKKDTIKEGLYELFACLSLVEESTKKNLGVNMKVEGHLVDYYDAVTP